MSEPYPLPSHACYIWAVGDQLHLSFPPLPGNEKSHSVILPNTPAGLQALGMVLRDRSRQAKPTIATKGTPTYLDMEKIVREMTRRVPSGKTKKDATADLSIADLDISALEF